MAQIDKSVEDNIYNLVEQFIKQAVPERLHAHYADTDDNDAQELRLSITELIEQECIKARLDEASTNYNSVIKAIQNGRDNPDLYWQDLADPIAHRIAQLTPPKEPREGKDG